MALTVGSLLIIALSLQTPERSNLYGEVWGDLEATGTIEERQSYDQFHISHLNVAPHGEDRDDISITITGVTGLVLHDLPEWNGSTVNTTIDVESGIVEVSIEEGHVACLIRDVDRVRSYSEFRGEAIPTGYFMDDPEYDIHTTISMSQASGRLYSEDNLELSDATITIDGRDYYVRKGAINMTGDVSLGFDITCEGSLSGTGYPDQRKTTEWVHIDGRLKIEDFREVTRDGQYGRYHQRLVVEGDDIIIRDHGGPYTWEHWYVNLEPWTIGITTDDSGGISSTNYTQALIGILLLWGLAFILITAILHRPEKVTDGAPSGTPSGVNQPIVEPATQYPMATEPRESTRTKVRSMAPLLGGVLCMANGLIVLSITISTDEYLFNEVCLMVGVVFPIIGFIGGAFAVMRKSFGIAVIGALATTVAPGFAVAGPVCMPLPWIGLIALGLIWYGRSEFTPMGGL